MVQPVQVHDIGQAAHIMVRFDGNRRSVNGNAFNYIRIDGSLPKQFDAFYLFCFFLENIDEQAYQWFCVLLQDQFCLPVLDKIFLSHQRLLHSVQYFYRFPAPVQIHFSAIRHYQQKCRDRLIADGFMN